MEEIRQLIEKLQKTELERVNALDRLNYVIDEAVKEMINILHSLYDILYRNDITIKSYGGRIFNLVEGIVLYSKGIEEKVVLTKDKQLIYYKAAHNELEEKLISPEYLLKNASFDGVYNYIMNILQEKIRLNNQEIIDYRNQTSKISKYIDELEREYNGQ